MMSSPSSFEGGPSAFTAGEGQTNWTLMYLLVASGVLLWAALENPPSEYVWFDRGEDGLLTYAVAVAAVSLATCGVLVIGLTTMGDGALRKSLFSVPRRGTVTVSTIIAVALAVWWCAAVAVLSFDGSRSSPYSTLSNGYIALWLGAACSVSMFSKAFGYPLGPDALLANLAASVVVLVAAKSLDSDEPNVTWAFCVGAISSAIHLLILFVGISKVRTDGLKMLAFLLLILWVPGAAILTFKGPFTSADNSNGFFGSWVGLLSALAFASYHL
jgi:hypothetical protein